MKKTLFNKLSFITLLCIATFGCILNSLISDPVPPSCPLPPSNLTESDFVGVWGANYRSGSGFDKLIIRADGTYKQIYKTAVPSSLPIDLETDWKKWRIEHRPSGFLFLHFEGMHRCDGFEEICLRDSGGMGDEQTANVCEGGFLSMPNEVILIVAGTDLPVPKGIKLLHGQLLGSDWNYSFQFSGETP